MPCRGVAPSYRTRSTWRLVRPREPHRKPGSCLRRPGCALDALSLLGGERFRLRADGGCVMLIIATVLRPLPMTIMISIIDMPTINAGVVFDERLEKYPHPSRKRRHAGVE